MKKAVALKLFLFLFVLLGLTACGGGGSDPAPTNDPAPTDPPSDPISISGGGVKGPLANAVVTVYAFDASQPGFKSAAVVATAATDANAAITGLALPFPVTPPYIMEFTSTPGSTTDITTGQFPVITTLRTVITQSLLDGGEQIYATPLTTMAVDIAVSNAADTNGTTGIQADEFEAALTAAASQVVSTLGFGLDSTVDIFDTPPLVDSSAVSTEQQAQVAAYRSAVEAVTAVAFLINEQSTGGDTDSVLAELAADLADGGGINGSAGTQINTNTLQVLEQDPATLPIPNSPTNQTVADVQAILVTEAATTAPTTSVTDLDIGGSITTTPAPAETNPDSDGDGVLNVDDAFPDDATETVDSDDDGIGDNADPDDNNNGILDVDEGSTPAPTATDIDGDGFDDGADNCPANFNPAQTNTDGVAEGDACDADDDNDGVDDTADAFPLDASESIDTDNDGLGNNIADDDDDNDGVLDGADTGVSPLDSTTACAVLIDCDGDGVFDGADFDPIDDTITFNFAPVVVNDAATVAEDAVTFSIGVTANDTDDDGNPADTVTLDAIGTNDTALGAIVINGNNIDYTPVANANGTDTFTYTVTDGTVTSEGSVSVTITAVNDVPVVNAAGPFGIAENIANAAVVGTVTATDVDSAISGYSITTGNTGNAFAVDASGQITVVDTVAIDFESATSFSLTITANDGVAVSAGEVVTVNVSNVNDTAPVVGAAGPFNIAEDIANATVVGTVSAADIDSVVTGYSISSGNVSNAFSVDALGEITVADTSVIDFETRTSYNLAITATDGINVSAAVAVVVNINDVNDTAPVVGAAGPFNVTEGVANTTVVGSVLATDVDSAVTGYSISAGNTGTAFAISVAGQITVANTGAIDYEAATSFTLTVTATDGVATSAGVPITVNINDINDEAPVVAPAGPFGVDEDAINTTVVGTVSATDVDSPVTGYTFDSGNIGNAFAISATGEITVADTSAIDFEGIALYSLIISATDGINSMLSSPVIININDVNDNAPVVGAAGPFSVSESAVNATIVGSVNASDVDTVGSVTGYSFSVGNTGNAFAISVAGEITVADASAIDFETITSFSLMVMATDGINVSVPELVTVNVDDINDTAPVVGAAGPFNIDEDATNATVVGSVLATDVDSAVTGYSISVGNTGGAFAISAAGQITVANTTAIDYEAATSFSLTVVATDGSFDSAGEVVTVNINNVNDTAPVVGVGQSFNVINTAVNTDVVGTVSATDVDSSITGFTISGSVFAIDASGQITVIDDANLVSSGPIYNLTVDAADGVATSVGESITINVVSNALPVIDQVGPIEVIMDEDEFPQAFVAPTISATDTDSLDWSTPGAANGLAEVFGTGVSSPTLISYTPDPDFNGIDSFVVEVTDGTSTVGITINVTVNSINDAPVALDDNVDTLLEDTPLYTTGNVLQNDTDTDGPSALTVSFVSISSSQGGIVSDNGDGTFDYIPPTNFNGLDLISYSVSDGADSSSATAVMTVSPVNDAPVATNDSESTSVNVGITTGDVLANDNDIDGDPLGISAADASSVNGGTVVNNADGTFGYTPATDFVGVDSFTYTLTDTVLTDVGTVTITVNPPGTPMAMADLLGPTEGGIAGLESYVDGTGFSQFAYWSDTYDSGAATFDFNEHEYNYATQVFDAFPETFQDLALVGGVWTAATAIKVDVANTGDGSMDISVVDATDTLLESFRISAQVVEISGDLMSSHLDFNWQAAMLDANAQFTAGAKLITSYQFKALSASYLMFQDDWCEFDDPTRFADLGGNCNGINSTIDSSGYATTLDQVIAATEWTDPDTGETPPSSIFFAWNDQNNTSAAVQLVAGGIANFYVIDWSSPDPAQSVSAPTVGSWVRDSTVQGVEMIRYTVPQSLVALFPNDLGEGLNYFLTLHTGFVRSGDFTEIGEVSLEYGSPLVNGIALNQVLANFDAPTLPDVTEALGTWVSDNPSSLGDSRLLHFFASGNYEVSGTCVFDGTTGMEYGTFTWDNLTGSYTATAQGVSTQGVCSPEQGGLAGNTISISGDVLTINTVSVGPLTYSRLKGSPNPLVGSWVLGNIQGQGEASLGGHTILTFIDDTTLTLSEDCTSDAAAGFEYGNYAWDQGNTNLLTGNLNVDTNGSCGLHDNNGFVIAGPTVTVSGDVLTIVETGETLIRHTPAFVPIVAAIPFSGLAGTEHFNVYFEGDTGEWVAEKMTFNMDGSTFDIIELDVNGDPVGVAPPGTYEIISGVLHIADGNNYDDFIMIMSVDATIGANRTCWVDAGTGYDDLANCIPPGEEFMFNNLNDALTLRNSLNTPAVFSGSAVNASIVFANGGIFGFEFGWDSLEYWALQWDGATVTDDSYDFDPGTGGFVLNTQTTDIALTSTGWQMADWRFDTQTQMATTATFQNLEGGVPLNEIDVTFNQMDITGLPLFDFVDSTLPQFMDNGVYSSGATAYEITFTENITYRFISLWDDFCGGAYNGNCNVVRSYQLDLVFVVGELSANAVEMDISFTGVDTTAIEIGYSNNGSSQQLFAVFKAGGVLEFWEVDWSVDNIAVLSGFTGSWVTNAVSTETLLEYTIPAGLLGGIYNFQFDSDDGQTGGFMSVENGYLRNGQIDSTAGETGTFIVLDPIAAQNVINSIQ